MTKKLNLEVLTQEELVFKDEVDLILAPAYEGQIGILPGHIGLLTKLQPGELYIVKGPSMIILAVSGGLLDVNLNQVSIMADSAIRATDIDIQKVEKAKVSAEKALKEKLSDRDFAVAQADLRKAVLELKVAKKKRYRHGI
ncbi:MAG: ATP synthase F1 subunit epsilon [Candidatus Beckwithbacteria bacterium]|nr:ATP synthase F1 subunit epsilon [Patescibacteria group bacterium]